MEHGIRRINLTPKQREAKILKDEPRIQKYRQLNDDTLKLMHEQKYDDQSFEMTGRLLESNAELYTIWDFRRDILINYYFQNTTQEDELDTLLSRELQFTTSKQYKFPKCYWIWSHRKWLLLQRPKKSKWINELGLVDMFFKADARNYHVWQYRRFVIECMIEYMDDIVESELNFQEFKFTTKMINKDISNYSAWHNRSKLIEKLIMNPPVVKDGNEANNDPYFKIFQTRSKILFLQEELKLITTAFYTDPEDSSVWFYIKWLFGDYFMEEISQGDKEKLEEVIVNTMNKIDELNELEKEDNFGKDNLWCLKIKVYLVQRLLKVGTEKGKALKDECESTIKRLIELDPMRSAMYDEMR